MKSLYFINLISCGLSQKIDYELLESGEVEDYYKVWIYFKDKVGSELINITEKTKQRRQTHATKIDNSWYDLTVSSDYISAIEAMGVDIENESRWLNAVSIICSQEDIEAISLFPFVKKIKPVKGYKKKYFNKIDIYQLDGRELDYGDANTQIEQITNKSTQIWSLLPVLAPFRSKNNLV